jgi:peptide/nickel transport system ATP-binding protein
MPLLAIEDLRVSIRGAQIIRGLSLQVADGEILGLVGASGSGKSMTALACVRLLPAGAHTTGAIRVRGESLTDAGEARLRQIRGRGVGLVFQEPMTALNPLMRIGAQVAETFTLHRAASAADARRRARRTLEEVGLGGIDGIERRLPHELSGGQRQRVAIAMAIALQPPLLIADEPTTALDAISQARVLDLLVGLARARGMGLILITHDLAVVARITDRIVLMREGSIVEQGAARDLLLEMRQPYERAVRRAGKAAAEGATADVAPLAAANIAPVATANVAPAPAADSASAAAPEHAGGGDSIGSPGPVLEVCGVVQEYRGRRRSLWHAAAAVRAVDGVSLSVGPGEIVGLVGESGSGKSSLLRIILALDAPREGEVRLLGKPFSGIRGAALKRRRCAIQAVFQDPYGSFDPRWTVERLIAEPFHLLDPPPGTLERRSRVAQALAEVGLPAGAAVRRAHEFSGGQRQRIAIARALVTRPAVIALDEAVSALDGVVRAQILELLADLAARLRIAYIFVSHDLDVVKSIADRVYVMRQGRIVEHGPTASVLGDPRDPYTQALIAAAPTPT